MIQRHREVTVVFGQQGVDDRIEEDQADEDTPCRLGEKVMKQQKGHQSEDEDPADQQQVEQGPREDGKEMNGFQSHPEKDLKEKDGAHHDHAGQKQGIQTDPLTATFKQLFHSSIFTEQQKYNYFPKSDKMSYLCLTLIVSST